MTGKKMMADSVEAVVGVTVAIIVTAFVLPVGIDAIVDVETTDWSDGAGSLFEILDLIAILAVFIAMIGFAMSQT